MKRIRSHKFQTSNLSLKSEAPPQKKIGQVQELAANIHVRTSPKKNRLIYLLFVWMLLVNIPSLQVIFPAFQQFYFREIATIFILLLLIVLAMGKKVRKNSVIIWFILIFLNTTLLVFISTSLDLLIRFKLLVSITILFSSIIIIPNFVTSANDIRKLFLFTLLINALLALTGPIQHIIGIIPELYPYENWHMVNIRGGFPRYISILGDPNIAGMIGGLLPLSILAIKTKYIHFWGIIIMGWSILILVFAQSLTGMLLFALSISTIWLGKRELIKLYTILVVIALPVMISFILTPDLITTKWDQFTGVVHLYTGQVHNPYPDAPKILPQTRRIWMDIDYRLFSYIDMNDTVKKVLFGSTYDVVTTSTNYNPEGIVAHNSYKEMYLAGGLTQLGLYLFLFSITALKAYKLIKRRKQMEYSLVGSALSACIMYYFLLFVMFFFPVYHYPGIGQIFWVSVIIINIVHDKWLVRAYKQSSKMGQARLLSMSEPG